MNDDTDSDNEALSERQTACDTGPSLSLDTILEVLANRRRRFALYTLTDRSDRVIEFETLIEDVVTLDATLTEAAVTCDRYLTIAADLYYWHLPVLADVGIIDNDTRHNTIQYLRHPRLESWIERIKRYELS